MLLTLLALPLSAAAGGLLHPLALPIRLRLTLPLLPTPSVCSPAYAAAPSLLPSPLACAGPLGASGSLFRGATLRHGPPAVRPAAAPARGGAVRAAYEGEKVLVANRGEIAVRIIRTCKEMGIPVVAVYSTIDANALHVSLADEAVCIGEAPSKDSYLNIPNIVAAAMSHNCTMLHPGYGFLAENATFADICLDHGLNFIGPKVRGAALPAAANGGSDRGRPEERGQADKCRGRSIVA